MPVSIARFLDAALATLMVGLLATTLILTGQAWRNYASADRIARLARTDHVLFDALIAIRIQVPRISTALLIQDHPRPLIDAAFLQASNAIATAQAELQASSDIADRARLLETTESAWRREQGLRSSVIDQLALPRQQRNLLAIDAWRLAVHGTINALNAASVAANNNVRIEDPFVAEMVQIRSFAWTVRDRYGLQCSTLRPNLDTNQPLSAVEEQTWRGYKEVYGFAWGALEELMRPGMPDSLHHRVVIAGQSIQHAQHRIDGIVDSLGTSAKAPVDSVTWTTLCDEPFDSILAIVYQAQDEAAEHAQALRTSALRGLLAAGFGLLFVTAFGVGAIAAVQQRLTRPARVLIGAIARLSRREYEERVPMTDRLDELGSIAHALETLRVSAREVERLQQAMGGFIADASHQMRTPLSVLRTHILVLDGLMPRDGAARSSLDDLSHAADRLQHLLLQLLKMARADSAQTASADLPLIDLREVVRESLASHVPRALEAKIDLRFDAEECVFPVRIDPIVVGEILANLTDNAINYSGAGGQVVVRLFVDGGSTILEVEDDGPGIPAAERDKVFERFYRLDRDHGKPGSGLGLAIARALATSIGAHIQLDSGSAGQGLCARVIF